MTRLNESLLSIIEARHHDPFAVLGRHSEKDTTVVCTFLPEAERVCIDGIEGSLPMERIPGSDLFEWRGATAQVTERYQLQWDDRQGYAHCHYDPYTFPPFISDYDLYLYSEGKHRRPHHFLGSNPVTHDGIEGILFALWAPNAARGSVVGDFNRWDGRCHPMRSRGSSGFWELFIPGLAAGSLAGNGHIDYFATVEEPLDVTWAQVPEWPGRWGFGKLESLQKRWCHNATHGIKREFWPHPTAQTFR